MQFIQNKKQSHLNSFIPEQTLVFCNEHRNILQGYSSNWKCTHGAGYCGETSCKKHFKKDKTQRHEKIALSRFLITLKNIKEQYQKFHDDFVHKKIPLFLFKLKKVTQTLTNFAKGVMVDDALICRNFVANPMNEVIIHLLREDPAEWDLSELSCRDVYQILSFEEQLSGQTEQKLHGKIEKILRNMLMVSLVNEKLYEEEEFQQQQLQQQKNTISIDKSILCLESPDVKGLNQLMLEKLQSFQQERFGREQINIKQLWIQLYDKKLQENVKNLNEVNEQTSPIKETIRNIKKICERAKVNQLHLFLKIPIEDSEFLKHLSIIADWVISKNLLIYTPQSISSTVVNSYKNLHFYNMQQIPTRR